MCVFFLGYGTGELGNNTSFYCSDVFPPTEKMES